MDVDQGETVGPRASRTRCLVTLLVACLGATVAPGDEGAGRLRPSEALIESLPCDGTREIPGWSTTNSPRPSAIAR